MTACRIEALQEQYQISIIERIKALAEQYKAIKEELSKRGLKDVTTERLIRLSMNYIRLLEEVQPETNLKDEDDIRMDCNIFELFRGM